MTTTQDEPVAELSTEECWELLERRAVRCGSAYRLVDEVHLVPVNYAADGRCAPDPHRRPATSCWRPALHSDVAFEIDWRDDRWPPGPSSPAAGLRQARRGRSGALADEPLRAAVGSTRQKHDVIELQPDVVTGRRFLLQRPEPGHQEPATD